MQQNSTSTRFPSALVLWGNRYINTSMTCISYIFFSAPFLFRVLCWVHHRCMQAVGEMASKIQKAISSHSLCSLPPLFSTHFGWVKEKLGSKEFVSRPGSNTVCVFTCGRPLVRSNTWLFFIFIAGIVDKTRDDRCSEETEFKWHQDVYTSLLFIDLTASMEFLSIVQAFNYQMKISTWPQARRLSSRRFWGGGGLYSSPGWTI